MLGMRRFQGPVREARLTPRLALGVGALSCAMLVAGLGHAETIGGALAKAYVNSPDINQQRAAVRAADEGIPKAFSGFLPTVSAQADASLQWLTLKGAGPANGSTFSQPRGYGLTVQENVWNGNRTINSVRQADSQVLQARETLRTTEQAVLSNALTSYMDVLRDTAILALNRSNVEVLQEQLRQTRDRFNVGEVTRTDVAQAESSLALAQATALTAQSTLQASIARYRQFIGDEPRSLAPVSPIVKPLPKSLSDAIAIGEIEHPTVVGALHGVDVAELNVKINEGVLYPTVGLTGNVTNSFDPLGFGRGTQSISASLMGQVNVPIYQGGAEYASVRQAKEQLSQSQLLADLARDQVRSSVVNFWGQNQNSVGILRADRAQVQAAEVALEGVREEAKVGQRTTLDVLNAQQTLLNARVQLVRDQHDQVVYSYLLLAAVGRLSIQYLGIAVAEYDPRVHFDQVKNKWIGLRTPDGK
jgi:outer membrane protein